MTKRGAKSGWQLTNLRMQRLEIQPQQPTRWDLFCAAHQIGDPLSALRNGKRAVIQEWASRHHDNAFIPELVLLELGFVSRWES